MKIVKKFLYILFYVILWPLVHLEYFKDYALYDDQKGILISEVKSFFKPWILPTILVFVAITTLHLFDVLTWQLVFLLGYLPPLIFQLIYMLLPDLGEALALVVLDIQAFVLASGVITIVLGVIYLPVL